MKHFSARFFTMAILSIGMTSCQKNSMKDTDGNSYKIVTIGTQTWMAENLRTTKYNDGTPIRQVTNYDSWANMTTPAYCWYNNDISNKDQYGALYNGYAVNTDKLCPKGWHVPADSNWTTLIIYLGGAMIAGNDMKEIGTVHWKSPNLGVTNISEFTALPGGNRSSNGSFNYIRVAGYWWSSTEISPGYMSFLILGYKSSFVSKNFNMNSSGYCVRCVMD